MKRYFFGCAAAGVLALASSVAAAQNPPYSPPPANPSPTVQDKSSAPVTVEGCLIREQDVPGRSPNVAEKAGMGEDYILASAKVIKGTAPAMAEPKAGEAVGTSGTNPMFDVKGIDDEQLKPLVGQRVQVEGTFEKADHPAMGSAKDTASTQDLADLHGTVIRHVDGECPAK